MPSSRLKANRRSSRFFWNKLLCFFSEGRDGRTEIRPALTSAGAKSAKPASSTPDRGLFFTIRTKRWWSLFRCVRSSQRDRSSGSLHKYRKFEIKTTADNLENFSQSLSSSDRIKPRFPVSSNLPSEEDLIPAARIEFQVFTSESCPRPSGGKEVTDSYF